MSACKNTLSECYHESNQNEKVQLNVLMTFSKQTLVTSLLYLIGNHPLLYRPSASSIGGRHCYGQSSLKERRTCIAVRVFIIFCSEYTRRSYVRDNAQAYSNMNNGANE